MHRKRIRGAIGFGSGTIGPFEEVATHSGSADTRPRDWRGRR
jgi:hypothetical protein